MKHYQIILPSGAVVPMSEEQLELYRKGEWDPENPEVRPDWEELKADIAKDLEQLDLGDEEENE